jgi:hypothetical protein
MFLLRMGIDPEVKGTKCVPAFKVQMIQPQFIERCNVSTKGVYLTLYEFTS